MNQRSDTLSHAINLRDIGGGITREGRRVRRGRVFRSAMPAALPETLIAEARALGIRSVIDLRGNEERARFPTPWEAIGCTDYWARDHSRAAGNLTIMMRELGTTPSQVRDAMIAHYRAFPVDQAESYRELFGRLLRDETPLLFHCAAGKDRTGVAAALILDLLDTPREAILADYLLTNDHDLRNSPVFRRSDSERASEYAEIREDVIGVMLISDADYLNAAFDEIDGSYGSVRAYADRELGIGAAEIATLRALLLEPA